MSITPTNNQEYYDSLKLIGDFLFENKAKADYVLNCFYQQDNMDLDEMTRAEGNMTQAQKFDLRMRSKKEQVDTIKLELSNFKNEKFKNKVAEFVHWIMYVIDPPSLFDPPKYPAELKSYLAGVKRYECDIVQIASEINRKFKNMSLTRGMPTA